MSPELERLIRLVPPPAAPFEAGGALSPALAPLADIPAEWRAFALAYGSGWFCDPAERGPNFEFLRIHNPFSRH